MKNEIITSVPLRLLNTPLLICEDEARRILAVAGGQQITGIKSQARAAGTNYTVTGQVAVIPVHGGLTYRGYGWYWQTTYRQIRLDFFSALEDPDVAAIVFDIDSPGGEVAGCFDLVDAIFEARGRKPVYAVANEDCYSAAYAIASAADKIYLSRTAGVGSVGVIAIHYEQSRWEENEGIKFTAIYAGRHKNDYTMHEPLSDEARRIAQQSVDRTYALFCETVARNRDMETDRIRKTEAAVFKGRDAVDAGLADAVMAWDEALAQIMGETGAGPETNATGGSMKVNAEELRTGLSSLLGDPATREEAEKMLGALGFCRQADQDDLDRQLAAAREEGKQAGAKEARQQAAAVIGACLTAGMPDMAAGLVEKGIAPDEAGKMILEAKSAANAGINSSTAPTGGTGKNPLIEDARSRAESAAA